MSVVMALSWHQAPAGAPKQLNAPKRINYARALLHDRIDHVGVVRMRSRMSRICKDVLERSGKRSGSVALLRSKIESNGAGGKRRRHGGLRGRLAKISCHRANARRT